MRVDQHRQHAQCLVGLDEAHATHVSGEIEDVRSPICSLSAILERAKIELTIFHIPEALVPLGGRLGVDSPDLLNAASTQVADEVSADEASCARYEHQTFFVG
jgi:hypothetical protein